jgi:predicted nucleic acid-binding protein
MINGLRYQARVSTDLPTPEVSQDPDDNPVLAMAAAGKADFLVSADKRDLLSLKVIDKTKIVTTRDFLDRIRPDT